MLGRQCKRSGETCRVCASPPGVRALIRPMQRTLAGHDDPEGRIGEPDRPVGRDRDIVRRIDPFSLVSSHHRLWLPIVIAARADASSAVLAVDERPV